MAGITSSKHTRVSVFTFSNIVKSVGNAVANIVDRPPHHFFYIDREGLDDAVCCSNHVILGEFAL